MCYILHSQTHRLGDTVEVRDAVTACQVYKAVPMSVHITTFIVHNWAILLPCSALIY